jgi:ribonuclease HII
VAGLTAGRTVGPSLRLERQLLRGGARSVACVDEVGRGALAGPVCLGVVVVTASTRSAPAGVRDSKLLTPARREQLAPRIGRWAEHAVAMASAEEVDRWGVVAAMRLAGVRALGMLRSPVDVVLLDGPHDYLSDPAQLTLFAGAADLPGAAVPPVVTRVRADVECSGVAAASVLAKVARDAVMVELDRCYPEYGFAGHSGYGTPEHLEVLGRLGPSPAHRVSWRLPRRCG